MTAPVRCLAFLTDFGTRDHYVGAMKGVALGICPEATLVDLTHEITPQDVLGGALELLAAAPYFPPGTVFVAVVDPGVGTARRALAAEAGGRRFVAPDNGLLAPVLEALGPAVVVALDNPAFARAAISRTFEGRDRFAPAAAWLARGTALESLGPRVDDWQRLAIPKPEVHGDALRGTILRVDRFGNLISNLDRLTVERFLAGAAADVWLDERPIGALAATYADVAIGATTALFSSGDHLEIAVRGGDAAGHLRAARGTVVTVRRR